MMGEAIAGATHLTRRCLAADQGAGSGGKGLGSLLLIASAQPDHPPFNDSDRQTCPSRVYQAASSDSAGSSARHLQRRSLDRILLREIPVASGWPPGLERAERC